MLAISSGEATCTIYPELGGSLASWTVAGQAMLRPADAAAIAEGDLRGMASFPLVPFSNRIGHGRFLWDGQTITLAQNFAPELHAIHGIGWQRVWSVADHNDDALTLTLSHAGDDKWPWPFAAIQRIRVGKDRLTLVLSVRNLADRAVPLAFGHHPYFDAACATLLFAADEVWMSGEDRLPTIPRPPNFLFDFRNGAPIEGRDIDHCYAGVSGPVRISWADRPLALEIMSSPQLEAAVVYIPKGGDVFCFEPVPHISNALNLPGHAPAMPVIALGETFETTIMMRALSNQNRASQT
jgi:aldose 1-epimerase